MAPACEMGKLSGHMQASHAPLKCRHCGEAIGSYEPTVVREGETTRETSRASDPSLSSDSAEVYHRACYATRGEQPSIAEGP